MKTIPGMGTDHVGLAPDQVEKGSPWSVGSLDAWCRDQVGYLTRAGRGNPASMAPHLSIQDFPADFARTSSELQHVGQVYAQLPWHVTAGLIAWAQRNDEPISVFLLSAFMALLHRYNGQDTQVVNIVLDAEGSVTAQGVTAMTLVASIEGTPTVQQLLAQTGLQLLHAHDQAHVAPDRPRQEPASTPFWFRARAQRPVADRDPLAALARTSPGMKPSVMLEAGFGGDDLFVSMAYDADLFAQDAMEQVLGRLLLLLDNMLRGQDLPISAMSIMSDQERSALESVWRLPSPYPADMTVHRMFERRAAETPDAVALIAGDREVSYADLDRLANATANRLRELGVEPGTPVGICMPRSVDLVVGLLAILKAGGAYVPFDPDYPAERLRFQSEDSQVTMVLVNEATGSVDLPQSIRRVQPASGVDHDVPPPNVEVGPEHLAYLCYTSGTTGRPKAAMIPHRGVIRLLFGIDYVALGPEETLMHMAPIAFDASTFELWAALLHGGRCVLYPAELPTGAGIAMHIRQHGVTTMWLTAALFNAVVDEDPGHLRGLRQLLVGGEALSIAHVRRAMAALPDVQIINGYGPTESTTFACCYRIPRELGGRASIPIGKPVGNTRCYVLDGHLRPVPPGVPGELYLGGAGLAKGYWRRPELSGQAFLANPFAAGGAARMYKTGDRARVLPDGNIEFLGRGDFQIKLRGYRIEAGEIESVLRELPEVRDAMVMARDNAVGEKVLVAYIVAGPSSATKDGEQILMQHLGTRLPAYMIPAKLIPVDSLPRTANGKVDWRRLPEPDWEADQAVGDQPARPRTKTEEAVARVWQEVLGLERVGVHQGFLELGGHSLLATQAIVRLRETFGMSLPLTLVFEAPTVAALAQAIEASMAAPQPDERFALEPVPRDQPLPLSFSQERVWFIQEMNTKANAYNFQAILRFHGDLQVDVLRRGLDEIVRRHEIFRTTYAAHDGKPYQVIHPPQPAYLLVEDLSHLSDRQQEAELATQLRRELDAPFDLGALPLIRWKLLRLRAGEHCLIQVEHHLVHDGWSFHVFLAELVALYRAFAAGEDTPLPPLPIQFADFACWQRQWMQGEPAARQLAYWKRTLQGAPTVWKLRLDRPRPPKQSMKGKVLRLELAPALAEAARALARREDATLFQVLFAVYLCLLHRYTAQDDLCVGTGIANRSRREVEDLIGMVINTIALRTDVSGDPTFTELLGRVKQVTREGYANQDVPFDQVVDALAVKRSLAYSPIYQTTFSFHDTPMPNLDLPGLTLALEEGLSNGSAKFDLNVIMMPRAEQDIRRTDSANNRGITMIWEYSTDILDGSTVEDMVERYQLLLSSLAADSAQTISKVPLLNAEERHRLLVEHNRTERPHATGRLVHRLFEERAALAPAAVALRDHERSLSYDELNRHANRVAHALLRQSIGKEDMVAVCMEHCAERVIAQLAVLKAGAAFVPLDPSYPRERLAGMLEDCDARVVFTRAADAGGLPPDVSGVIRLDTEWQSLGDLPEHDPDVRVAPRDLAYVIFTSGSTGRPKGVLIEHGSLSNLVHWHIDAFQVTASDRGALLAGPGFDASVWELWPNLVAGASLVVTPPDMRIDPERLRHWLIDENITLTFVPTPVAERMLTMQWPERMPLRALLTGGDKLEHHPGRDLPFTLYNNYGPSENTVVATSGPVPVEPEGLRAPTIGRAIANTQVYILDAHLEPVPEGVPGELFIGGSSLARGYLGQPQLTAERFLANPFTPDPSARIYRTGDRARYLRDGQIEFLGRVDEQVQVRGFRIELGEINIALGRHPAVADAATTARHDDAVGTYLVSYVVASSQPRPGDLREHLKRWLPAYMLPSVFVFMDALPMTPNGKVDKSRLPDPDDIGKLARPSFQAPCTELEQSVAAIWRAVLDKDPIGIHDDFFDLGGHSLVASQIISRINQQLSAGLPLQVIFDAPTVAGLCATIEHGRGESEAQAVIPTTDSAAALLARIDELSEEEVEALLSQMNGEEMQP